MHKAGNRLAVLIGAAMTVGTLAAAVQDGGLGEWECECGSDTEKDLATTTFMTQSDETINRKLGLPSGTPVCTDNGAGKKTCNLAQHMRCGKLPEAEADKPYCYFSPLLTSNILNANITNVRYCSITTKAGEFELDERSSMIGIKKYCAVNWVKRDDGTFECPARDDDGVYLASTWECDPSRDAKETPAKASGTSVLVAPATTALCILLAFILLGIGEKFNKI